MLIAQQPSPWRPKIANVAGHRVPGTGHRKIDAGYADFAERWNPILDVFDEVGVLIAHEVHPSDIADDSWTTVATLEAIDHRPASGLNSDPSHVVRQGLDHVGFLDDFRDLILHVDRKDTKVRMDKHRDGRLGSHPPWADPPHGGDFISTGGDIRWEDAFWRLNLVGCTGPISVEWDDAATARLAGTPEALAIVRGMNVVSAPEAAFDAAFSMH